MKSSRLEKHLPQLAGPGLIQASFTRHGGVSSAPFASLNLGFQVGDREENVRCNRQQVKEMLGINILVSALQVHGDQVFVLKKQPDEDLQVEGFDALLTDIAGIGLMIQQADCQAVSLFDPERPAVGIIHAGWRGSVAGIIGKTVAAMEQEFGSTAADLQAAISPALGPCCAQFINFCTELPAAFHAFQVRAAYFNFPAISVHQLLEAGLNRENIKTSELCTRCSTDFFSYRREGKTGRSATVIGLRGQESATV